MSDSVSSQSPPPPATRVRRGTPDLLGACLLLSLIIHAIVLLGLNFRSPPAPAARPSMDVSLLESSDRQPPQHADFLAQATNSGAGDSDQVAKPSAPVSGQLPTPQAGLAAQPLAASLARPDDAEQHAPLVTRAEVADTVDASANRHPHDSPEAEADSTQEAQQMASLAAALDAQSQAYAKRPRKKFISASTREYAYAAYMQHWVERIERSGNLNYPAIARAQHLYGALILSVGLRRDGQVASIDLIQSSGQPALDRAARQIVDQAGPFPPLPADQHQVDLLYITRTWQFLPGNRLHAQ